MNKKEPNRMIILIALAMSTFATGGVYAWSVLSGPLAEAHGWDYGAVTLAYSILLLMLKTLPYPTLTVMLCCCLKRYLMMQWLLMFQTVKKPSVKKPMNPYYCLSRLQMNISLKLQLELPMSFS